MRKGIALAATVAALTLLSAAPAGAAIVTTNYTVIGDGTGTFTLDFNDATLAYSLTALDFSFDAATFNTSNASLGSLGTDLYIGGNLSGVGVVIGSVSPDFFFGFKPSLSSQKSIFFSYTGAGSVQAGTLFITQGTVPRYPEPATWAMMLFGFGAAGLAIRRRKQAKLTFPRST